MERMKAMPFKYFNVVGNVLFMEIDSEINKDKLNGICNEIEQAAATLGKVRLLLELKHYPSLNSAEDLYDDLRFVKLYANCIDKVAIVCDKTWKRTWVGLFSAFSGVEIGFFDKSEKEELSNWIQKE